MNALRSLTFAALCFGLSACTLQPFEDFSTLQFKINNPPHTDFAQEHLSLASPQNFQSLSCYAINVMGYNIDPLWSGFDKQSFLTARANGSACAYPGIASQYISVSDPTPASIEITVPSGADRHVQWFGIYDQNNTVCSSSDTLLALNGSSVSNVFELGSTRVNAFGNTSVALANAYDGTFRPLKYQKQLNCDTDKLVFPFDPRTLSGLRLWLDASYYAQTYDYGTSLNTSWGNEIASVSPNNIAITSGNVLLSNALNKRPSLALATGANNHTSNAGFGIAVSELTIYYIAKSTDPIAQGYFGMSEAGNYGSPVGEDFISVQNVASFAPYVTIQGNSISQSSAPITNYSTSQLYLYEFILERPSAYVAATLNLYGASGVTGTTTVTHSNATDLNLDSYIHVGSVGGLGLIGNLAEFMVFTRKLNATERASMQKYFKEKYGLF